MSAARFSRKLFLMALALLSSSFSAQGAEPALFTSEPVRDLVLDRVIDNVSVREDALTHKVMVRVKGRILVGGAQRKLPSGLNRDSHSFCG